jgi:hypothetical protein
VEPAPEPRPEGALIRYWRELARMGVEEAVAAFAAAATARGERGKGARISAGYWRSVELNRGSSRGKRTEVRASAPVLARMAQVVPGVTPERLRAAAAEYADGEDRARVAKAADMLAEILGRQAPAPAPQTPPLPDWAPEPPAESMARAEQMITAARAKLNRWQVTGTDIFGTGSPSLAAIWDDPALPEEALRVRLLARVLEAIEPAQGAGGKGQSAG